MPWNRNPKPRITSVTLFRGITKPQTSRSSISQETQNTKCMHKRGRIIGRQCQWIQRCKAYKIRRLRKWQIQIKSGSTTKSTAHHFTTSSQEVANEILKQLKLAQGPPVRTKPLHPQTRANQIPPQLPRQLKWYNIEEKYTNHKTHECYFRPRYENPNQGISPQQQANPQ